MKWLLVSVAVLAVCAPVAVQAKNGGTNCAICTAVVAILEQLTEYKNSTIVETVDKVCDLFPPPFTGVCREAFSYVGPSLIKLVIHKNGPDVVCHALNFCFTEKGAPTCRSRSPPLEANQHLPFEVKVMMAKKLIQDDLKLAKLSAPVDICEVPGIKLVCEWLNRTLTERSPLVDFDGDGFSPSMTFRGSAWRGKDCMDFVRRVHPGAKPMGQDLFSDTNCNGIYGVDKKTNKAYEDEFCSDSKAMGVVTLGDSLAAHFSFPPVWIDATRINAESFKVLPLVLQDEADWPMLGSFTGHGTNEWTSVIEGPIDSIYKRMVERNRCNHRDYQNIAINGGDSFNIHKLMKTLSRDQVNDKPVLLFLSLLGNDVCQGKSQDLNKMTTPKEMHDNTLETLEFLSETLPAGSHVMVIGLADGQVLFDSMHQRTHPIFNYWGGFTYGQFYDYMMCMGLSPCLAWLNSNQTERDLASKRVEELNTVLRDLGQEKKSSYKNFDFHYIDDPLKGVLKEWADQGGHPYQLVEQADGFHSNQMGQALTSQALWEEIEATVPEALGPVNPNNDRIAKIFGDQGGL